MSPTWRDRLSAGLSRTRESLTAGIDALAGRPALSDESWDELGDALLSADLGVTVTTDVLDRMRTAVRRESLVGREDIRSRLASLIAEEFPTGWADPFEENPVTVLLVGVNGTGKTTSVGKIAAAAARSGRNVLVGSGDTYRAAAVEQLREWCERASVPVVEMDRGSDPAAVVFDTMAAARTTGADLVLVDTAGRLHNSPDLMAELSKVQRVARAQSAYPVRSVLVIDATTGQNALAQARAFDEALGLDGIVLTKLDGTARGGIAVAIVRELGLPILRIGVGEALDDMHAFDAVEFSRALAGVS